jgi:hypothetical protein
MKQITVMIVGVECQPLAIQICEGATAGEILNELDNGRLPAGEGA